MASPLDDPLEAGVTLHPPVSAIEKAYIRGVREGQRRGRAKIAEQGARITELVIRLKTAKGELKRRELGL